MRARHTIIIGVGNPYRSDDAAGLAVARRIQQHAHDTITALEFAAVDLNLHECWGEYDSVILIDAVSSGSPPGTIFRFDPTMCPLPVSMFHTSTHSVGIGEAIEFARVMERIPRSILVYGIEGANFLPGEGLSPRVHSAVESLSDIVLREVENSREEERSATHA